MRSLLLICLLVVMSRAMSQDKASLRPYLVKNKLIDKSQLVAYDSFQVDMIRSTATAYREAIDSVQTEDEKAMYREALARLEKQDISERNQEPYGDDTLQILRQYLIVSCKGSINISAMDISAYYDDSIRANPPPAEPLASFLGSLKKAGLVSEKNHQLTLKQIRDHKIFDSFSVVSAVMDEGAREDHYNPRDVRRYLMMLKKTGLISQEGSDKIMKLANSYDLYSDLDILAECKQAVIINLDDLPDYPEGYMKPFYEKIASLRPELAFTNFSVKTESYKIPYDTITNYHNIVSLRNGGRQYMSKDFYSPSDFDKDGRPDNEWKTGDYPESIFNKILRDRQSTYRLHPVSKRFSIQQNDSRIGFILLTKMQWDSLREYRFLPATPQNFKPGITSSGIEKAITLYKKLGLFSHLSPAEYDSCVAAIPAKSIEYYSDILSSFKNLVFDIDLEYGPDDGQYKEITEQIAAISKGHFNPQNIVDEFTWEKRKSFKYGFILNGKSYSTTLGQDDDWLDPKFFELIDTATQEQDKDKAGQFYDLYPADGPRWIYLTHQQAEILKKAKVIELSEEDVKE